MDCWVWTAGCGLLDEQCLLWHVGCIVAGCGNDSCRIAVCGRGGCRIGGCEMLIVGLLGVGLLCMECWV